MIALLIAALLQAPTVDDRVAAFVKGDAAARAELVKLGVYAIRPLLAVRDRDPEKVNPLLFEIKSAIARPQDAGLVAQVAGAGDGKAFVLNPARGAWAFDEVLGLPLFFDGDRSTDSRRELMHCPGGKMSNREILDLMTGQVGLDWGLFHGFVVLAKPERLWPDRPAIRATPVTEGEVRQAREWIEALDEELVETREAAIRGLRGLGRAVLPLLHAQLSRKEADLVAACTSLIAELSPFDVLGPPAVDRQRLTSPDAETLKKLKEAKFTDTGGRHRLKDALALVGKSAGVVMRVSPAAADSEVSLRITNRVPFDVLCLVTQLNGLDFTLEEGVVVVDTRATIDLKVIKGLQDGHVAASIDDHIAAFAKGDAAARAELMKFGAYAIRQLQKSRDKSPEKIDELVFELKKAAAFPRPANFDPSIDGTRGAGGDFDQGLLEMMCTRLIPFVLDPVDTARITKRINVEGNSARVLAEQVCQQTGLDYGYFHNAIVFAHPDRLWPPMPPPDKGPPVGAGLERAKLLVSQLNHEMIETRESATRELLRMGRGLAPFLKEQLKRSEPEIVARCRLLLMELTPKTGAYGPAAVHRQVLDEAGKVVLRQLSGTKFSLSADRQTLKRIVDIVNKSQPVACEIPDELAMKTTSIAVRALTAIDILSLLTQSLDLDFMIQGTGVLIDTREAIQKAISKGSE